MRVLLLAVALTWSASITTVIAQPARELVQPQATRFAHKRSNIRLDDPAVTAAACLAYVAMAASGVEGATEALEQAAGALLASAVRNGRRVAWTLGSTVRLAGACKAAGTHDAFNDGTCNGPETAYSIHNAYAIICLARAHGLLPKREYKGLAQAAMEYWSEVGRAPCTGCWHFLYSDHANDRDRFVRNTNVVMGAAAAWVYRVTNERRFAELARASYLADAYEVANGNMGYLGRNDPLHRSNPDHYAQIIDNHVPVVAWSLGQIGILAREPGASELAVTVYRSWRKCDSRFCRAAPCERWAGRVTGCRVSMAAAPCLLMNIVHSEKGACAAALIENRTLTTFQLWAAYEAKLIEFFKLAP